MSIKPILPTSQKMMWHVTAQISQDNLPIAIFITNNPYVHTDKAAVILHKTASKQCATQVARYARRTLHIESAPIKKHTVSREGMIGAAVTTMTQYQATKQTPCYNMVLHIASTPISQLLKEVEGGHNAARVRYVVYEVRTNGKPHGRFISNKTHSIDRMWNEAPPDKVVRPSVHVIGRFESRQEAELLANAFNPIVHAELWTRKPKIEWLRAYLKIVGADILFVTTDESAVTQYANTQMVLIGSHSYTKAQVMVVLKTGIWHDGRITKNDAAWYLGTE